MNNGLCILKWHFCDCVRLSYISSPREYSHGDKLLTEVALRGLFNIMYFDAEELVKFVSPLIPCLFVIFAFIHTKL